MSTTKTKVNGVIFSIGSDDVDLTTWCPSSNEDVYITLAIQIGDSTSTSSDLFYTKVATPEGLRKIAKQPILSARGLIVVNKYSYLSLEKEILRIIDISVTSDWNESTQRLQRYFIWEYEDMQ